MVATEANLREDLASKVLAQVADRLVALDLERVQRALLVDSVRYPHENLLDIVECRYWQGDIHERLESHGDVVTVSFRAPDR